MGLIGMYGHRFLEFELSGVVRWLAVGRTRSLGGQLDRKVIRHFLYIERAFER